MTTYTQEALIGQPRTATIAERSLPWNAGSISNHDLIVSLVGEKAAAKLAARAEFGSLLAIANSTREDLADIVGKTAAGKLAAVNELARRVTREAMPEMPQVRSPADVANLVMLEMGQLEQEEFRVAILDTKNCVRHIHTVYVGNTNTVVLKIGEVFREAVRRRAVSIVVMHNHPSGDPTPSPEDVRVTEQLVEAGKLMDIDVLDHLVIGRNRYVSLKERGLGFRY